MEAVRDAWSGSVTWRSCAAGNFSFRDADSPADRLLSGKALGNEGVKSTPLDWTTYRANNSRSGSSPATVPSTGRVRWTWTPNPPFDDKAEADASLETQSTQAVSVGDRVLFGTAAGIVRCLDRKTRTGIMELCHGRADHLRADFLGRQGLRRLGRRLRVLPECGRRQPGLAVSSCRPSNVGSWSSATHELLADQRECPGAASVDAGACTAAVQADWSARWPMLRRV